MYASPTKCTQVRRGVRMQKKTRPKWPYVSGIWLYAAELSSHEGHPCAHRLFFPGITSQVRCFFFFFFFFFFVNVLHVWGLVWRTIVSNRKVGESPFSSSLLRLWDFRLIRRQRQCKYRVWYGVKPLVVARLVRRFQRTSSWLITSWDF